MVQRKYPQIVEEVIAKRKKNLSIQQPNFSHIKPSPVSVVRYRRPSDKGAGLPVKSPHKKRFLCKCSFKFSLDPEKYPIVSCPWCGRTVESS